RTAEAKKAIGIADEQAAQEIKVQQAVTAEKEMAVQRVNEVKTAEIAKEKAVVKAQEDKEVTVTVAEGDLEATRKEAEGIKAKGETEAAAEEAMQMAPVKAKIALAEKIGANPRYMQFLVSEFAVAAHKGIGEAQAKALDGADVKIIANTGDNAS